MCAHGLQLDQRETGDFLKVTLIPGRYRVPALQGTGPDQQIVEGMTTPFADNSPASSAVLSVTPENQSRDSTMEVTCNSQVFTPRNRASDELTTVRHHIAAHLPVIGPNGHKRS